jgi:hypothetical protein
MNSNLISLIIQYKIQYCLVYTHTNTKYLKYDWRNQIRLTKFTPISQQYMLQLVYLCTIFWIYCIYLHIWTTDKKYIHTKTYCLWSFFYTSCMGNAQLSYINIIHAILYIIIHSFFLWTPVHFSPATFYSKEMHVFPDRK